ncbi:MAG: hypothetical protein FWF10_03445 [Clostridiales bacterium]|nr:hypothetical protein [Clostridiales bacterium]
MEPNWTPLDNAAKIYPAASRRSWSALFRVSVNLSEAVDPSILLAALHRVAGRLPVFFMRLQRGAFWYYLEDANVGLRVEEEGVCPCLPLRHAENNGYSFRVLYYKNRISAEFYHILTDGAGGMVFLKTLVAEYLEIKYGILVPRSKDILDCRIGPRAEDARDSFLEHAGKVGGSRGEKRAFRIQGTPSGGFHHLTTAKVPTDAILAAAKAAGATLTEYLTALMIRAVQDLQETAQARETRRKPVKINVPVNLRRFFPSETLRNFSSYVNPGIDPRLGRYSFEEVLTQVRHQIGAQATRKHLAAKFTQNVLDAQNKVLRLAPLFLKNLVLKSVFMLVGDALTSTCLSNLGQQNLPSEMARYVERMDFILGPLSLNPIACACLSYNGTLYFNVTRSIEESSFERTLFRSLVERGVPVEVESNQRSAMFNAQCRMKR